MHFQHGYTFQSRNIIILYTVPIAHQKSTDPLKLPIQAQVLRKLINSKWPLHLLVPTHFSNAWHKAHIRKGSFDHTLQTGAPIPEGGCAKCHHPWQ